MATNHPIVFSEMKAKVGIDDIAYSLGYRLDKKAGVGKYYELVLGDVNAPTDRIVVKNTPDKSQQVYFRRDGSKGDVVGFIKENLNSFVVEGKSDWTKVANVLAKFSNTPTVDISERSYVQSSSGSSRKFEPERYNVYAVDPYRMPWILKDRGFSAECIKDFGDNVVLIKDTRNKAYDGLNIAFPYTNPENQALAGYEIRGNKGFKSKATGTDSAHSAWIAEFPRQNPEAIRNVFFFESSFDAMSFYQLNKARIVHTPFALVSVGGAFGSNLVENIMKRFPAAKAWDCFDNDPAGQVYSANLVKTVDKVDFSLDANDGNINLKFGDKEIQCPKESFDFRLSARSLGMIYSCGHWKSPNNFKDWNDCLMGKQIQPTLTPSKYQRDENLANQRASVKM